MVLISAFNLFCENWEIMPLCVRSTEQLMLPVAVFPKWKTFYALNDQVFKLSSFYLGRNVILILEVSPKTFYFRRNPILVAAADILYHPEVFGLWRCFPRLWVLSFPHHVFWKLIFYWVSSDVLIGWIFTSAPHFCFCIGLFFFFFKENKTILFKKAPFPSWLKRVFRHWDFSPSFLPSRPWRLFFCDLLPWLISNPCAAFAIVLSKSPRQTEQNTCLVARSCSYIIIL